MARSVRTRITMLATIVALGVSVLVCVGVYLGLHYSLYREVDGFLVGEVHEFRAILTHEQDDGLQEIEKEIRTEIGSRNNTDLVFRLLDNSGNLLITSDPDDSFSDPWDISSIPAASLPGVASFESIEVKESGAPFRVCSQRERMEDHGNVVIQAAYRIDRVQRSLAVSRMMCIAILAVAAALSVFGGRTVARGSLAPVVKMTKAARQINAKRLSARVPLAETNDELDALAQTLNEMLDRVEQSFRQIQQFTADAAHELRTPLTALRGTAEHALAQPRSEEQLRAVIEKSLEYYRLLGRVTDDLLLLARLDAGQEPLKFEPFSLTKAVEDVVDLYRPLAAENEIEMIHKLQNGPVFVMGDSGKLRRVLNNLLDNSIKYMGGNGKIEITLDQQDGMVSLMVSDTGPGISPEDLPHVFERFYRGDRSRNTSTDAPKRSAGLGLAICQSIVNAHCGEIVIGCEPGEGTAAIVRLPSLRRERDEAQG